MNKNLVFRWPKNIGLHPKHKHTFYHDKKQWLLFKKETSRNNLHFSFQVLSTYVHILSDQKVDKMLEFMDFTYATNEVHVLSWRVETSLYGTISLNQSHVG